VNTHQSMQFHIREMFLLEKSVFIWVDVVQVTDAFCMQKLTMCGKYVH